ncbi:hypothetical protein, partial [Mycobacteroides abscessus]|uniref:hypothetical protein n=1 Tax=Mycobacteroides abscessus TaxID=36809 RepID=UPI001F409C64
GTRTSFQLTRPGQANSDVTYSCSRPKGYQYAVVIQADAWPLRRLCPVSIYLAGIAFDLAVFGVPPISQ